MLSNVRVIQMIPAEGWLAVYDAGSNDVTSLHTRALACWALIEGPDPNRPGEDEQGPAPAPQASGIPDAATPPTTRIIGVDADKIAGLHPPGRFVGYAREGESLERFRTA